MNKHFAFAPTPAPFLLYSQQFYLAETKILLPSDIASVTGVHLRQHPAVLLNVRILRPTHYDFVFLEPKHIVSHINRITKMILNSQPLDGGEQKHTNNKNTVTKFNSWYARYLLLKKSQHYKAHSGTGQLTYLPDQWNHKYQNFSNFISVTHSTAYVSVPDRCATILKKGWCSAERTAPSISQNGIASHHGLNFIRFF